MYKKVVVAQTDDVFFTLKREREREYSSSYDN